MAHELGGPNGNDRPWNSANTSQFLLDELREFEKLHMAHLV
jgi:hypothetical protein